MPVHFICTGASCPPCVWGNLRLPLSDGSPLAADPAINYLLLSITSCRHRRKVLKPPGRAPAVAPRARPKRDADAMEEDEDEDEADEEEAGEEGEGGEAGPSTSAAPGQPPQPKKKRKVAVKEERAWSPGSAAAFAAPPALRRTTIAKSTEAHQERQQKIQVRFGVYTYGCFCYSRMKCCGCGCGCVDVDALERCGSRFNRRRQFVGHQFMSLNRAMDWELALGGLLSYFLYNVSSTAFHIQHVCSEDSACMYVRTHMPARVTIGQEAVRPLVPDRYSLHVRLTTPRLTSCASAPSQWHLDWLSKRHPIHSTIRLTAQA